MLIGHSNGGPTVYSFLAAMSPEWCEQYICGQIGLSGNFLGQMNGYKDFFVSGDEARQAMLASWEAMYTSASWGGYAGVQDVGPILTTHASTALEANFTSSLSDLTGLSRSMGRANWDMRLEATYNSMDRTEPPGSDTYCLYACDLDSSYSFVVDGAIPTSATQSVRYINGDGNQDLVDKTFCEQWTGSSAFKFEAKGFSGVEHMHICAPMLRS